LNFIVSIINMSEKLTPSSDFNAFCEKVLRNRVKHINIPASCGSSVFVLSNQKNVETIDLTGFTDDVTAERLIYEASERINWRLKIDSPEAYFILVHSPREYSPEKVARYFEACENVRLQNQRSIVSVTIGSPFNMPSSIELSLK
jgi:hypothetical protein